MQSTVIYYHPTDRFPYQPIDPLWMFVFSLPTLIFFFIIDRTVKLKSSFKQDLAARWLQHNTFVSFVHSSLSSILIIIAVLRAPDMLDDPLSHINFFNYAVIAFSLGYFCWDFLDCLKNSTSSVLAILFHHVIVISFLLHILLFTRNIGYGLHALSLEINSVFLHGRRLLRWYPPITLSVSNQRLLRSSVDIGNYITFFLFRFGIVINGLHELHVQQYRLDPIIYYFTGLCVATIGVLNIVLFYRLVKSRHSNKKKSKREMVSDDSIVITDHQVFLPS